MASTLGAGRALRSERGLYGLLFLFSACSISYELILARLFSVMSSQEIVWHSVTIGVYVLALGLGTALSEALLGRQGNGRERSGRPPSPLVLLFALELLLAILGASSVWLIWEWHTFLRLNWLESLVTVSASWRLQPVDFTILGGQILCFLIGLLSGFELPLLAASLKQLHPDKPEQSGLVLAANYAGTLGGTLALLFILAPHVSLGMAAWLTAASNLLGALVLLSLWCSRFMSSKKQLFAAGFVLLELGLLALVGLDLGRAEQLSLQATYYLSNAAAREGFSHGQTRETLAKHPDVVILRSPYQSLHMVRPAGSPFRGPELAVGEDFSLYLNRHFQISTETEGLYHEFFVHYPLALLGSRKMPKKVLVLGGGDGLAARELLKYDEIASITQVELDPVMIELSTRNPVFVALNEHAMADPRVTLIEDDAFTFLKNHHEEYEAIFIDFPYPYSFDLSRLYSVEFYSFVLQNLSPGGFAVFDMPLIPKTDPHTQNRIINDIWASTLEAAGFGFLSPFGGQGEDLDELETFMIAMKEGPNGPPPPYTAPRFPFKHLFSNQLTHHSAGSFAMERRPELVNSLFRPRLLGLRSTFL